MISVIRNNSSTMVNRKNKETSLEFLGTGVRNCDRTNKWFAEDSIFFDRILYFLIDFEFMKEIDKRFIAQKNRFPRCIFVSQLVVK